MACNWVQWLAKNRDMRLFLLFALIVVLVSGAVVREKRQFIPLSGDALFPESTWSRYNRYHNVLDQILGK
nr:unnamed protein product [Haemonchus contortus]